MIDLWNITISLLLSKIVSGELFPCDHVMFILLSSNICQGLFKHVVLGFSGLAIYIELYIQSKLVDWRKRTDILIMLFERLLSFDWLFWSIFLFSALGVGERFSENGSDEFVFLMLAFTVEFSKIFMFQSFFSCNSFMRVIGQ